MLDPDDEQVLKDAKEGGCVLVTWNRVLLEAAGGLTPYEALDKAKAEPQRYRPKYPGYIVFPIETSALCATPLIRLMNYSVRGLKSTRCEPR